MFRSFAQTKTKEEDRNNVVTAKAVGRFSLLQEQEQAEAAPKSFNSALPALSRGPAPGWGFGTLVSHVRGWMIFQQPSIELLFLSDIVGSFSSLPPAGSLVKVFLHACSAQQGGGTISSPHHKMGCGGLVVCIRSQGEVSCTHSAVRPEVSLGPGSSSGSEDNFSGQMVDFPQRSSSPLLWVIGDASLRRVMIPCLSSLR